MPNQCDDARLSKLIGQLQSDGDHAEQITDLLGEFPDDARLHFLLGSTLIEQGRMIEAHRALTRAVSLAPDFAIARFQLGLFQLTSGEADKALETWGRLDALPDAHYLRKFVDGLRALIRDDFQSAIGNLQNGIQANTENPPLNRDMTLLIEKCREHLDSPTDADAASETTLLLQQFGKRNHVH